MLHTFAVYVEDKPGVLNRIASLFRRRAFNIDSLTVGHTETEGVSRMTIVCDADETSARRIEANVYKLVNVLRVDDLSHLASIDRELATIVQEGLDVNVAIINNGYLGMVRQWQEFFYEKRYAATPLIGPDFSKLAQAFGIDAVAVSQRSEVAAAVQGARKSRRATVIDFQVEQEDSVFPMVPAGADLDAMIRRPSPIVETAAD